MTGVLAGQSRNISGATVYFDTNPLVNITRSSNLNISFIKNISSSNVIITQTVMSEAENNLSGRDYAALSSHVYGNPYNVITPYTGHPAGNNNGEGSIVYHLSRSNPGGQVIIVSGDGLSNHRGSD